MMAVILRDMRTRFFNHGLGFLVQSLWPLTHIFVLLFLNTYAGRSAPYGSSPMVFFGAGVVPTLTFIYISRFMAYSIILNKNMLSFPIVRVTDIIYGRAFLEISAGFITLLFIWIIFIAMGVDPYPDDPLQAVFAYLATILLALGVGSIISVMTTILPIFVTVYALMTILFYLGSGCLFVTPNLPDQIAIPLSYNPIVQCVEWMRTAYFESYSDRLLDREYILSFGGVCLLIGLLAEKYSKRLMLDAG
ncbi:ABC transporter permease [Rhizobium sp. BK491]|uniref:ABC transporter permease n=1 Tax=Rhizobium sp. BK491 TaxID=2587009 RepID=UPI0017AF4A87|nr:ABC transporter permease [Rhizobium sp. BK491]MBB3570173.1 capsular polysaccharide transport system permease protein [Rhizobium sp. BK491]